MAHWNATLNNHRFEDMTTYPTKDINLITPVGVHLRGQQQLVQGLHGIFDNMFKGVPMKAANVSVRAIAPEVAVVNEEVASGVSYPPDGIDRGTNKVPAGRDLVTMVLVKKSGQWLGRAGQVTRVDEMAVKQSQAMASTKK